MKGGVAHFPVHVPLHGGWENGLPATHELQDSFLTKQIRALASAEASLYSMKSSRDLED